jgi:hypothetical protein
MSIEYAYALQNYAKTRAYVYILFINTTLMRNFGVLIVRLICFLYCFFYHKILKIKILSYIFMEFLT